MTSLRNHIMSMEDQESLRTQISAAGLVAFVIDGAILPRQSGADDRPMSKVHAVPFKSPDSMKRSFKLPYRDRVVGMGIRRGVTVICGGGFHGKSTLLKALEVGCYNHIPNDGREFVVTSCDAVKIRAEDGRCVTNLDISPFINNLPFKKKTTNFSTPDASGSTVSICSVLFAHVTKHTHTHFSLKQRILLKLCKSVRPRFSSMRTLVPQIS